MATRGQVRRAVIAIDFYARSRFKRKPPEYPPCVTCGAPSTHEFAKGEPAYGCGPHEPITLDPDTIERARREFGRA